MRTRLAIVSMLVMGVLMSGAGAGLAVTGLSGSGSAGTAQYGPPAAPGVGPTQNVLGANAQGTPQTTSSPSNGVQGVEAQNNGTGNGVAGVQSGRQVATEDSNDLPFTGYAAIPVLLIGIALLLTGAVMRRRVQTDAGLR